MKYYIYIIVCYVFYWLISIYLSLAVSISMRKSLTNFVRFLIKWKIKLDVICWKYVKIIEISDCTGASKQTMRLFKLKIKN